LQSLMAWQRTIVGWRTLAQIDANGPKTASYLEVESSTNLDDNDFEMDEESPRNLEMWGPMGGYGGYGYGGYGGYPQQPQQPQQPAFDEKARRQIEQTTEYSMMYYLKYLNLITARKMETAQNTHYQSRAVTSVLQGLGSTNGYASYVLYMLYYRDVIQTLMSSQSIQRHDIWTVWNFLEIMETIESPTKNNVPDSLLLSIKNAYATSMRVFATEAMYDFQTLMLDYYIQPMLAQIAGSGSGYTWSNYSANTNTNSSFLEVEETAQPEKPFFGMGSQPQMMTYYVYMFKFYAKYLLLNAAQTLSQEAQATYFSDKSFSPKNPVPAKHIMMMKSNGLATLHQWIQIKTYLLYFDMSILMMSPGYPQQSVDGPAAHFSNLVQTDDKVAPQADQPRVENPVIENQVPAVAVPQQLPQQPAPHQSVVG